VDLEPRLLRYFLAVANELHFGRAAASLYVSQPALSSQIRKLERTLGADLFVRTSRQVELTIAGRTLLDEAPLALAALERAAERARLAGDGIAGTVRLGYSPMAGYEILGTILKAVEHDIPNVTVIASEFFSSAIPGRAATTPTSERCHLADAEAGAREEMLISPPRPGEARLAVAGRTAGADAPTADPPLLSLPYGPCRYGTRTSQKRLASRRSGCGPCSPDAVSEMKSPTGLLGSPVYP
jgi:hypothetical protein